MEKAKAARRRLALVKKGNVLFDKRHFVMW